MNTEYSWKDVETVFPGLKEVWKKLKAIHEIHTRSPKYFSVTDEPMHSTPWNDSYVGRLHRLDLETMEVGSDAMCTSYDVAPYVREGMVGDTGRMDGNVACINLQWNDHYRHVVLKVQVAKGRLPCASLV